MSASLLYAQTFGVRYGTEKINHCERDSDPYSPLRYAAYHAAASQYGAARPEYVR